MSESAQVGANGCGEGARAVRPVAFYRDVDRLFRAGAGGTPGLGQLLAPGPLVLSPADWDMRRRRFSVIETFFRVTLDLFTASLHGEADPRIAKLLINDCPPALGTDHHRGLAAHLFTPPLFFRTDEAPDGTLYEIQCPGSGWGEYELVRDLYAQHGLLDGETSVPSLARGFVEEVTALGLADEPILHLTDNASAPAGVRYFINRTRPQLRYFSWDADIKSLDCGLIRSHCFFSTMAENFASRRLRAAEEKGSPLFDVPPHVTFAQKAPMALPFWSVTRGAFPDAVRALFPHTQLVTPDGFEMPDGEHITLHRFASLPKGRRHFYLKNAGCDPAWNWGSQSVTRLHGSSRSVLTALELAARRTAAGSPWIVQPEHTRREPVTWTDPATGEEREGVFHAKYSAYHGPRGLLAVLAESRDHTKVHSQTDTVMRPCAAGPPV
ncbi:hypothetical protein AB0G54_02120 [Streptomyces yokosukanensis]|uniref:hypothetical protein n=1 Tax=Streptomyces yokosukanensis TaxID=67386 RepID=UPI00131CEC4E|nr:hypothetical protein [Streptomyces yokosukanensis]